MTQLGRVEYCLNGGASNTDFIDNAGGVDCSDHEVNIKILLNEIVASGDMTGKQRNKLLAEMTDAVGSLVLGNNYKQTQALSLAQRRARERIAEYKRLMAALEADGKLDRALEFLPSDEQLAERIANGQALTRAELAVLISYSKIDLKESLLKSQVPDDEYLARDMRTAFPPLLSVKFAEAMGRHRLKREIVSTQIANDLVNHMGITLVQRMKESTGMSAANVAGAYVIVRDVFRLPHWWQQIEALDYQVPAELQLTLMDELMRLGRRTTRWMLPVMWRILRHGWRLWPAAWMSCLTAQCASNGWRASKVMSRRVRLRRWRGWWRVPVTCTPCCRSLRPPTSPARTQRGGPVPTLLSAVRWT